MNDIPLTLFSGGAIAATTILVTFFTWLANRTMAHQSQIKNLEDKMDHGFKHLEDKIDSAIKHMDEKVDDSKERISRLEKYFDIIMQTQIKKNSDQFKMEG